MKVTISKDSKLCVNGEETRYAIFPSSVAINTEEINVWGYNEKGEFWFQLEKGTDVGEPYLAEWYYSWALSKCNEENHNAHLYEYKWLYRCMKEHFSVEKRTLWYRGGFHEFVTDVTSSDPYATAQGGFGYLAIPYEQFYEVYDHNDYDNWGNISFLADGVIEDNDLMTNTNNTRLWSGYFRVQCNPSVKSQQERQATMTTAVEMIDAKIYELYGFTPDNRPKTREEKVKVAKVIYDWLRLNNKYHPEAQTTLEWENQCIYSALSLGDRHPVCRGYANAAHLLLNRYGIVNISCSGPFAPNTWHAWNIVNYQAVYGEGYKKNNSVMWSPNNWCVFDSTGNQEGTITDGWEYFNHTATNILEFQNCPEGTYPVRVLYDSRNKYDYETKGYIEYAWE